MDLVTSRWLQAVVRDYRRERRTMRWAFVLLIVAAFIASLAFWFPFDMRGYQDGQVLVNPPADYRWTISFTPVENQVVLDYWTTKGERKSHTYSLGCLAGRPIRLRNAY